MTQLEKLEMLKVLADCDDSDTVLLAFLETAGRKIINRAYPYAADTVTEVPARYDSLQVEIAAYLLNKRGAEGQTEHIENGIHRHYGSADVPAAMLSEVVPFCGGIR